MQAYILADTTYNSLSVDEVAAAHVNAQCVVREQPTIECQSHRVHGELLALHALHAAHVAR